jgi:hypothetical protein
MREEIAHVVFPVELREIKTSQIHGDDDGD